MIDIAKLYAEWKREVLSRGGEIDPDDAHDWHSLALGWLIGRGGMDIDTAIHCACELHYYEEK
jgi:hypothetical protein